MSDGRMLVRIDCQVLADHVGRTSAGGRIDHLHLFKVYAAAESLAVGPSYQWIDNVELDPTLTSAECP